MPRLPWWIPRISRLSTSQGGTARRDQRLAALSLERLAAFFCRAPLAAAAFFWRAPLATAVFLRAALIPALTLSLKLCFLSCAAPLLDFRAPWKSFCSDILAGRLAKMAIITAAHCVLGNALPARSIIC